jgi:hypothetical protein
MNLIPIDELIEAWIHKDLSWWREACQYLRPTPEDNATAEDEDEKR